MDKPPETVADRKISMVWPDAVWKALGRRAARNRRSATAEALVIVERALADEEGAK